MAKQGDIVTGTYEGTGAAINISVGFVPDYVRIINQEDNDALWEWFNGYPAGTATATAAAVADLAANGVTAYTGTTSAAAGFTVGTALSESGKTHYYLAMRNSQ